MVVSSLQNHNEILIAADHAGFDLKEYLKLNLSGYKLIDIGPNSNARCDYPDYAAKVAEQISSNQNKLGILVCGSGIGMCITANKFIGVRAAVVESETSAKLSKAHNNANILCLGSRILSPELALKIVKSWLEATFEGGRHLLRINKILAIETGKK